MDLTAVIFVLLAVAWAVYLIPKALKHHDEVARTRSIDEFSPSMRVLASREPVGGRDPRLVVSARPSPPRTSSASAPAAPAPADPAPVAERHESRVPERRLAARRAARRRRRILALLLLATVGTAVAAALAYVAWWTVAVPGGGVLGFLVLCRVLVRREVRQEARRPASRPAASDAPVIPQQPTAPHVEQRPVDEHRVASFDDGEDTVDIPVAMLQAAAVATSMPAAETSGSSLWDPLPMTLPTYVTAPKARRTVRTIDLGEPGTWTSGRTAEDSRIAAAAADAQAATDASTSTYDSPSQRAVGD